MKLGHEHHISVTRDHINKGVPRNCDRCAISLAMNEYFTKYIRENGLEDYRAETSTDIMGIQISYVCKNDFNKGKNVPFIRFSSEMERWVDIYDSGVIEDQVLIGKDISDPITVVVNTETFRARLEEPKQPTKQQSSVWDMIAGGE